MRRIFAFFFIAFGCWHSTAQTDLAHLIYWFDGQSANLVEQTLIPTENVDFIDDLDVSVLSAGMHNMVWFVKDAEGQCSSPQSKSIIKIDTNGIQLHYWWDDDMGNMVSIPAGGTDWVDFDQTIDLSSLSPGVHRLCMSFSDAGGRMSRPLCKNIVKTGATGIQQLNYWWDDDMGNMVSIPAGGTDWIDFDQTIDLSSLSTGVHRLCMSFSDAGGRVSSPLCKHIIKTVDLPGGLIAYRFWVGDDIGDAIVIELPSPSNLIDLQTVFDLSSANLGLQPVTFQVRDNGLKWSAPVTSETNIIGCGGFETFAVLDVSACDSYDIFGQTLTASGTYNLIGVNQVGCDSIVTLNLTINQSTFAVLNETVCSEFILNGMAYDTSGVYTQTLFNAAGCDSTITVNLNVNPDLFGGSVLVHITVDGVTPVSEVPVDLFNYTVPGNAFFPTSGLTDAAGNALIEQVMPGNYIVRAQPDPTNVNQQLYLTTYYSQTFHWPFANQIEVNECLQNEVIIDMIQLPQPESGPGQASGYVMTYDFDREGDPIPGIPIIVLRDTTTTSAPPVEYNYDYMSLALTDEDGYYEFTGLPFGHFMLLITYPGLETFPHPDMMADTTAHKFKVVPSLPDSLVYEQLNYYVDEMLGVFLDTCLAGDTSCFTGIDNLIRQTNKWSVYPNPFSRYINLRCESNLSQILDLDLFAPEGTIVASWKSVFADRELMLDIGGLSSGLYFLRIRDDDEVVVLKLTKR